MITFREFFSDLQESSISKDPSSLPKHAKYEDHIVKKIVDSGYGTGTVYKNLGKSNPTAPDYIFQDSKRNHHGLEIKQDHHARHMQANVKHYGERGWDFDEEFKTRRPNTHAHLVKTGILDHLNKHWGDPTKTQIKDTYLDDPNNGNGVEATYADKGVNYIHIGKHGMYHMGENGDKAKLGTDRLPQDAGLRIRGRAKSPGKNKDGSQRPLQYNISYEPRPGGAKILKPSSKSLDSQIS